MFDALRATTDFSVAEAQTVAIFSRQERTLIQRLGVFAAAAVVAASLSVALPLQFQDAPHFDGHGTSLQNAVSPLSINADGPTGVTYVVTKGQKG